MSGITQSVVVTLQLATSTWPDLRSMAGSVVSPGCLLRWTDRCPMVLSVQDLMETEEGEQIGRKCDRTLSGVRQVCARKHTCPGEYKAVQS